ncbi:hypothetical protein GGQ88_001221 [Novosphingobium hassiacum]|uniref:Phytase-like domain-containing protein n=1 Tax=Novosphingobium hassiacum TaxID=173676 RepID=A0A7W5ZU20_9SPHN|nr:esterase-like activity of phytase family protein [Novosphingobium hassiacum]MBB3859960.1 hypothetical protein [Novosphingobium hassiacum]
MRKFSALIALFAPLLWITWGWQPVPTADSHAQVRVEDLTPGVAAAERTALGPFRLDRLWRLSADHRRFGGYSALVPLDSGELLAISDRNAWIRIAEPLRPGRTRWPIGRLIARRGSKGLDFGFDVEAAVRDSTDGSLWLGLEKEWHVARIGPQPARLRFTGIRALRTWPENGGAEAMTRLNDGRWVLLCESCDSGGAHIGLAFAGRPGQSAMQRFAIILPAGFDPVDMAPLPDGRVLILTRKLELFPPRFVSRIVLADMARLDASRPLATRELARIEGASVRENYEGMAIRADGRSRVTVWLIADANDTAFQETRLMQLSLDPAALP